MLLEALDDDETVVYKAAAGKHLEEVRGRQLVKQPPFHTECCSAVSMQLNSADSKLILPVNLKVERFYVF